MSKVFFETLPEFLQFYAENSEESFAYDNDVLTGDEVYTLFKDADEGNDTWYFSELNRDVQ